MKKPNKNLRELINHCQGKFKKPAKNVIEQPVNICGLVDRSYQRCCEYQSKQIVVQEGNGYKMKYQCGRAT